MMTSWFDDLIEKDEVMELKILGIRLGDIVDSTLIDKDKIESHYREVVDLINSDEEDMDEIPRICSEIKSDMNNHELIVLRKLLSTHKYGWHNKGYHTMFEEYAATFEGGTE